MAPRPTVYKGILMRSRLEASFAAYLDTFNDMPWQYEPRAYAGTGGQYLPDFVVDSGKLPMFFEVKPTVDRVQAAGDRMRIIWESEPTAYLLVAVADGSLWAVGSKHTTQLTIDDEPAAWR